MIPAITPEILITLRRKVYNDTGLEPIHVYLGERQVRDLLPYIDADREEIFSMEIFLVDEMDYIGFDCE